MDEHSNNIVRTTDVIGKSVCNTEYEDLGKIEEIALCKISGHTKYFVLSFGTFMGMGGKYFAFPWKAISYDNAKDVFILNVSKDKLDVSQGFDKDSWPDMAQQEWQHKTDSYYGVSNTEKHIDKGILDSFPASDPPAHNYPGARQAENE